MALITTGSPEAQRLFDQGLVLVYGFNHWKTLESQGRTTDAARARADFRQVWKVADVPLRLEEL